MGTRLYVGNLPFDSTEEDLRSLFGQAGQVVNCDVISDKFTGKSRGFAFVEMASQDDANKAIQQFNGNEVGGRSIVVNEARPREERSRDDRPPRRDSMGGGYGGGGGGGRRGYDRDGGGRHERY